jgi:hypothetical protein
MRDNDVKSNGAPNKYVSVKNFIMKRDDVYGVKEKRDDSAKLLKTSLRAINNSS